MSGGVNRWAPDRASGAKPPSALAYLAQLTSRRPCGAEPRFPAMPQRTEAALVD